MSRLTLFHAPRTRASRVAWMLEEAGLDFDIERVDIMAAKREEPPGFREASPMGKVPAIADGEVRMADSAAICIYIADRYAPGRLAPPIDHPDRGRFLYWTLYTPAVVEPAMAEKAAGVEPNPGRNAWGSFDRMIDTLEAGLGDQDWILGDGFSAADVMLGSSVIFLRLFGMLPERERLSAYADRCAARAAYRGAMALDEA